MSESLEQAAELRKLSLLLETEVPGLDEMPSAELRAFRNRLTDLFFDADADRLARVGAATKLVPIALAAKIAEAAFGPLLCATVAGLVETDRAIKIADRLPVGFLADVTVHLDPRRAGDIITGVDPRLVREVGRELARRGEWVTIGRFVALLPERSLRESLDVLEDAGLLQIAFVLEGKDRLDDMFALARPRLPGVIRAAQKHGLWREALDLLAHISDQHRQELAGLAVVQEEEVLHELLQTALDAGLWLDLLPLTAHLSEPAQEVVARTVAGYDAATLTALAETLIDAAADDDGLLDLLPLLETVPHLEGAMAEILGKLPPDVLQHVRERAKAVGREAELDRLLG